MLRRVKRAVVVRFRPSSGTAPKDGRRDKGDVCDPLSIAAEFQVTGGDAAKKGNKAAWSADHNAPALRVAGYQP